MDEAERLADRVAIIDHGQLLVLDTPEALRGRVGAGDVLEIHLNGQETQEQTINKTLADLGKEITTLISGKTLTIRTLNAVNLLPAILDRLALAGYMPGEVRLRQNTLEDVFIQLTGRRLRE